MLEASTFEVSICNHIMKAQAEISIAPLVFDTVFSYGLGNGFLEEIA